MREEGRESFVLSVDLRCFSPFAASAVLLISYLCLQPVAYLVAIAEFEPECFHLRNGERLQPIGRVDGFVRARRHFPRANLQFLKERSQILLLAWRLSK